MVKPKSLTVIICADVLLTWLSEVPLDLLAEVGQSIEERVGEVLRELFAGASVEIQPPIIDDRSIFEIMQDDD